MVTIKLFKQDGDKTLTWKAELKKPATILYTWGQDGGKLQTKIATYTKGKNIGKKNETSPFEQAHSEMIAKAQKKLDKGYYRDGEKPVSNVPLPMLAYPIDKHEKKVKGTIYIQPKLDGIRCIADIKTGKLYSRRGKEILSLPHISQGVKELGVAEYLDGELYSHDLTFQEITSIVRKEKELDERYKKIKYRIYDVVDEKKKFSERYYKLYDIGVLNFGNSIKDVETIKLDIADGKELYDDLRPYYETYLVHEYEGIMIRLDKPYRIGKRCDSLLKYKPMQDDEYEIIGYEKEKYVERLGKFNLKTKDGKEFGARPSMSHDELKDIYSNINKYIGALATVQFQELTDDGIPRFPVVKGIRWKEDM